MKLWIGAGAVAMLLALGVVLAVDALTDDPDRTPGPAPIAIDVTASPSPHATFTTVSTLSPRPTAPLSCSFGTGIWEQCEKQAQSPAFADLFARYHFPPNSGAVVSSEYIEWPDSCLGITQPGVLCLQVITPGFRIVLRAADHPFVEYHTDLNGTALFFAEYDTLPSSTP